MASAMKLMLKEFPRMSKHVSLSAAVAFAAIVAMPAASEASCLHFDRLGVRATDAVHDTGRALRRIGDGVVRVGDRAFGWLFCRHKV
jgi:hypothetical protein